MAERFTGTKCIVCGETFKDDDDIVVCPDCGTPYHRACWPEDNKCINISLHESGQFWTAPATEQELSGEPVRCVRCGTENPAGQRFCGQCGLPLFTDQNAERPFNDPSQFGAMPGGGQYGGMQGNGTQYGQGQQPGGFGFGAGPGIQQIKLTPQSDIDGVKLGDYLEYVGRQSFSIIANFVKFAKTPSKISFNLAALFFPEYYFFYRKMNSRGILFMIVSFVLSIPMLIYYGQNGSLGMTLFKTGIDVASSEFASLVNLCSVASTIVSVVAGFYANYWYYRKAHEDIMGIRSDPLLDEEEVVERIKKRGGTSWAGVIAAVVAEMVISLGFLLLMTALY